MKARVILDSKKFQLTIDRLCYELIEKHDSFIDTCFIGVQPRGTFLSDRIIKKLKEKSPKEEFKYGALDVTFYRDDFRRREKIIQPNKTTINFSIENKRVILIDDVLYTGRTIRSAMDALLDFGRPKNVELLSLIDRRFSRHVPIHADYVGQTVDAIISEVVKVEWAETQGEDKVWILTNPEKQ